VIDESGDSHPSDRVLIGVIRRRTDLAILLQERWYRIPVEAAPGCVNMEYIGFYTSARLAGSNGRGAIRYYARLAGFELARRRDLLPTEADHPRRNALYFKLQFREILSKEPPILNTARRAFAFLFTDWEHFAAARIISDLRT